ncbi:hypothetical protein EMIT0324P_110091 [Pseudomonas chlororaphis]
MNVLVLCFYKFVYDGKIYFYIAHIYPLNCVFRVAQSRIKFTVNTLCRRRFFDRKKDCSFEKGKVFG